MKPATVHASEWLTALGVATFGVTDGFVAWTGLFVAVAALGVAVWASDERPPDPPAMD